MQANRLGDVRAEHDREMLSKAFYRSPDFLTLIEPANRAKCIVVGRRGTGKSALMYKLVESLLHQPNVLLLQIAPEDFEIICLRSFGKSISGKYSLLRAGFKLLWRYALVMEFASVLPPRYKGQQTLQFAELIGHASSWRRLGPNVFERMAALFKNISNHLSFDDNVIASIASKLPVRDLENTLASELEDADLTAVALIDRLDEGYEPDPAGLGIIGGLLHAVTNIGGMSKRLAMTVFLRDNIFRGIALEDSDFARNIEGQVLRIHWERYDLFNMICARLRVAYSLTQESNQKIWDACTAQDIRGPDGFIRCLRLTLYRPRDLLLLLNEAIYRADSQNKNHIDNSDVESTAKQISTNRLLDLEKEYEAIVGGLPDIIRICSGRKTTYLVGELRAALELASSSPSAGAFRQHLALVGVHKTIFQLYSIGFIGVHDEATGYYTFCYDGKLAEIDLPDQKRILIHPCYWIGLGITEAAINPEVVKDVRDFEEIRVEVISETPTLRQEKVDALVNELALIQLGSEGAAAFEEWCARVVGVVFAQSLKNISLHPNPADTTRRDIVATNYGLDPVWKRVFDDYQARQVVFEVKNYDHDLGLDECRQLLSYLSGDYGSIGFFITRSPNMDLHRGAEIEAFRAMYLGQRKLMVKLSGEWLGHALGKIAKPQKHDAPSTLLGGLIDRYVRTYMATKAPSL